MNSLERVCAALSFKKPDRVPVIAQVFGHAAVNAGVDLYDYLHNGEILANCQIENLEYYQYDAVFALMDTSVETEAIGSTLVQPRHQYPHIGQYAADSVGIASFKVPNPLKDGRMPELLNAATLLRGKLGDSVPVIGCVLGPMTLATQLTGIEKALYMAIDQPKDFSGLLEFSTEVAISFGLAQLKAGVHLPIVFDPSSTPTVIPPQFYREFVMPCLKQVFKAFKDNGSLINWLHTAGPVEPILSYYPQANVELANIDYCVDPAVAMQQLPNTCINGNIKPLSFVDGTIEDISDAAASLLNTFKDRGGFILSPGCEIPLEAKPKNIAAMVKAVKS